jgi:hypothetical protein
MIVNIPKCKDVVLSIIKFLKSEGHLTDEYELESHFTQKEFDISTDLKFYRLNNQLTKKRKKINQNKIKCSLCNKEFKHQRYLSQHLRKVHYNFRLYICQFCGISYKQNISKFIF